MEYVSPQEIRAQAGKFYFVLLAWPLFLFLMPGIFGALGPWSLVLVVFPGFYLFTWLGYLMHECWHRYVPTLPNALLYRIFSWMLITDPQIYKLLHGHHHSEVNTYEDREFHPLGRIENRTWRRIYHGLEIFAGVAFLTLATLWVVPKLPKYAAKYRASESWLSLAVWSLFLGGLGWLSHLAFGAPWQAIVIPYALTYGLGSVLLHHSQLVEHGNLIAEGDWNQRNVKTRNLRRQSLAEKLFLFMTHHDSQEHVLHHTQTPAYLRPFPGRVPLPPEAVRISFRDYANILGDMLAGRDSRI